MVFLIKHLSSATPVHSVHRAWLTPSVSALR